MNTINSQKSYDLNGILLSSPPIDVLWIMYLQEFKKCEKMHLLIQVIVSMS
jgi:hypothetical protein